MNGQTTVTLFLGPQDGLTVPVKVGSDRVRIPIDKTPDVHVYTKDAAGKFVYSGRERADADSRHNLPR
jgi:hypothetical protein